MDFCIVTVKVLNSYETVTKYLGEKNADTGRRYCNYEKKASMRQSGMGSAAYGSGFSFQMLWLWACDDACPSQSRKNNQGSQAGLTGKIYRIHKLAI
jgi:hypothetical protein